MPPRVHFSPHPCVVAGVTPPEERPPFVPPPWHCDPRRQRARLQSTDTSAITCRWCLPHASQYDGRLAPYERGLNVRRVCECISRGEKPHMLQRLSAKDLVALAWVGCCRELGVESPFTQDVTTELLASIAERRSHDAFHGIAISLQAFLEAEERRSRVGRHVERLRAVDERLGEAVQPAVDVALVAFDVLEEAERLLAIARDVLDAARTATVSIPIAQFADVWRGRSVQPERGCEERVAIGEKLRPKALREARHDVLERSGEVGSFLQAPRVVVDITDEHLRTRENHRGEKASEERRDLVGGDLQHPIEIISQDGAS